MSKLAKTVVLDVVALTKGFISAEDTPNLWKFSDSGRRATNVNPPLPAVTCVSQATYLTGVPPSKHGVTANGYYDPDLRQIFNWHQSAGAVKSERLYAKVKKLDPDATVFVHTWWHSMYDENIDYLVTVRPEYHANGKKSPNTYTNPAALREEIHEKHGVYPLLRFWGPLTSIESSQWIADTAKQVDEKYDPTLSMIYLPHLDYSLQKFGPDRSSEHVRKDLREIDRVVGELISYYESKGAAVLVLSEYGISPVSRPVHINRELRKAGYIAVRKERGGETLDCGASPAFAVADHQVAHVHVKRKEDVEQVRKVLEQIDGVDTVLTAKAMKDTYYSGRCGDILCLASTDAWFTYYFWEEDDQAPDYAHCVAIHDKPGYDPTEMFLRFAKPFEMVGVAYLILKAVLSQVVGIRTLVDATPIDQAAEIRGSHGLVPKDASFLPVLIVDPSKVSFPTKQPVEATDVLSILLSLLKRKPS